MTTEEIEALYLKHAADFRCLLDCSEKEAYVTKWIENVVLRPPKRSRDRWQADDLDTGGFVSLPSQVAVAAMTESWRDRLEKEHRVALEYDGRGYSPTRYVPHYRQVFCGGRFMFLAEACGPTGYTDLPKAICAAVHSLAEEKRKAEKPKPSAAALRAAEQICLLVNHWITNPGPNPSRDHFAAIIDGEMPTSQHPNQKGQQ